MAIETKTAPSPGNLSQKVLTDLLRDVRIIQDQVTPRGAKRLKASVIWGPLVVRVREQEDSSIVIEAWRNGLDPLTETTPTIIATIPA